MTKEEVENRQREADEVCCRIYDETREFYFSELKPALKDDPGYQILYGPPLFQTPVLFVGYQPGNGTKNPFEEREYGTEDGWPERSEFVTECWPLAMALRRIFNKDFIEKCVGTNVIFVRASDVKTYGKFDKNLRAKIREFCKPRVELMVKAIQPKLIVAIGLATLDLFGPSEETLRGAAHGARGKSSALIKKGKIAGREALAVMHLSGARIPRQDRKAIADSLQDITHQVIAVG